MAILVNCHFQTDDTKVKREVIQFYDIRKHNLDALGKALSTHRWGAVYADNDIRSGYSIFLKTLHHFIQLHIPLKTVTMRDTDSWFVTPLTKSLLRKRSRLRHQGKIQAANDLSNKINKIIKETRRSVFNDSSSKNTTKMWQCIRKAKPRTVK